MSAGDAAHEGTKRRGRPPKLAPEQVEDLVELVRANPLLSLDDLVRFFRRERGVSLSAVTIRKYLREAGFERKRPEKRATASTSEASGEGGAKKGEAPPAAYGYGKAHRDPGDAVRYPCGLTDSEWEQVRHLFDPPGKTGRPAKYPRRQMLDACIYVLRSGCSWRMLPKDFPPWTAVYRTFRRWLARDLFEELYDELRKLLRGRERRNPDPTGALLDSQSVKTSPQGGPKGYDAGKKVKGRKRHLVTDTLGLLIAVLVTAADVQDRDAAMPAMDRAMAKVPGIKMLYADGGYAGTRAQEIRERHDVEVEIVRHPGNRKRRTMARGPASTLQHPSGIRRPAQALDHRAHQRMERPPPKDEQGSRPPSRCLDRLDLARRRP